MGCVGCVDDDKSYECVGSGVVVDVVEFFCGVF